LSEKRQVFCEVTGRTLELPKRLQRIVSLSPAITETLYELGLGDKVVGVSAFDVHPEEARKKPILGSYSHTNIDKLITLEPELVFLTTGYQRDLALKLADIFPVYAIELPTSVGSIIDTVRRIGLVTGELQAGNMLSKRLFQTVCEIPKVTHGRAYIEIDLGGPVSFGAYSYLTDALNLLGGSNIFADEPREWLTPDFQVVRAAAPEIILYEPKMFRRESLIEVSKKFISRGWADLESVRGNRIFISPGPADMMAHHGPSFITKTMPWMAECLRRLV
jgi:ABC-type Fe3+-hydroxamate transport system substrate-binding protein